MYQASLHELKNVAKADEYAFNGSVVQRYIIHSSTWVTQSGAYFDIQLRHAKASFWRVILQERTRSDHESNSPRVNDLLPCVLELQHVMQRTIIAERTTRYKAILSLPKTQVARKSTVSAFAVGLHDPT